MPKTGIHKMCGHPATSIWNDITEYEVVINDNDGVNVGALYGIIDGERDEYWCNHCGNSIHESEIVAGDKYVPSDNAQVTIEINFLHQVLATVEFAIAAQTDWINDSGVDDSVADIGYRLGMLKHYQEQANRLRLKLGLAEVEDD